MAYFQWDEHFVTGLVKVDKQHRHLVDVINHFGGMLTRPEVLAFSAFEKIFAQLVAYADYHFAEEESLMDEVGVDQRHVENHKSMHADFLRDVGRLQSSISPGNTNQSHQIFTFLSHWLAYHILGCDQSLARQISAIQSGKQAAEAYLAEQEIKEGAVEPLLHTLDDLCKQLSDRNRELLELNQTLETRILERTEALANANQELTELVKKLEVEKEESSRLSRELETANRQLEAMALTDVLTGLPNRRHALKFLAQAWAESVRNNTPLACLMIDVDDFKNINDSYGHGAGDLVLRQLSTQLRHAVRVEDMLCRLGGDEFLIICPRTEMEGAMHVAERARQAAATLTLPLDSGVWNGSISVGVAVRQPDMSEPEDLIKTTDEGVYAAKRNGRNCIAAAC